MAEAGSFAEKVKQQADIVRVVGEYVPLKKAGQNFRGLCPFHAEKSPSFNVHPTKQIYHCFGCGQGGDVFKFVMEMEKCPFPEAIRIVAEKCGIAVPRPKERSPEERKENQLRAVLVEIHREAQTFFVKQLEGTLEGKAARAYLEDRGMDRDTMARFGIGLRSERRRFAAATFAREISGKDAGGVRIDFAGPERAALRPVPATDYVSDRE